MLGLGAITFLNPWVLAGLVALPVLWWLLRTIPPSPRTQTFAGVRLLLGLEDEERQSDKTPWWLLLLRCLAIAAALIGFSQPVANLTERLAGQGPVLVLMDQGWASAPDWVARKDMARAVIEEADQAGRQVILWPAASGEVPPVTAAKAALDNLASLQPEPWAPDPQAVLEALTADDRGISEAVWLHDGLSRDGTADLLAALDDLGPLRLIGPAAPARALTPPRLVEARLTADVLDAGPGGTAAVVAYATAEGGGERRIAVAETEITDGRGTVTFDLPTALQSTVTRIALADRASAGGAAFADGAIRRVTAGMVARESDGGGIKLTSAAHYISKALVPWADLNSGTLAEILADPPQALILSDFGNLDDDQRAALTAWVEDGGILIRFAGPRLAASIGAQGFGSVRADDPLLPVRLRRGGRVLGGALAWSSPRALGPFPEGSPFRGLAASDEVDVRTQVLAEPSPDLAGKVWASLDDGTPLVTAKPLGDGQVVLFHVSADAEWSSLPLSGLFVEMLGRLVALAPGRAPGVPAADDLAGTLWRADMLMGPDGAPMSPSGFDGTVPGERIAAGTPGPGLPPGIYVQAGAAGQKKDADSIVLNLTSLETALQGFPDPPAGVTVETLGGTAPDRYGPLLIALAVALILADVLGTLVASGRLSAGTAKAARAAPLALALAVAGLAGAAHAQERDAPVSSEAIAATAETTLGYVMTGDPRIDDVSQAGMRGLGNALARRTAVEPGPPIGVVPGEDELSFYPVLYMPLVATALPERRALDALAAYIRNGGMLIIDTQNGASGFGGASATQMREIARALNLPPLAPVGDDHVLTRTFYLLSSFPGRWRGGVIWSEAAPPRPEGVPEDIDIPQFDRIDDNVSPVIVGSADWASAWATDERGQPLFPIGRPGDRQREMAIRFGVNAVMYALTGNYKSDQVHAPEVLRRLGQ